MKIDNRLFQQSFNVQKWQNKGKIDFLLSNLSQIETSVLGYLKGIREDFPNLTDHSLSHSRMLWNYAEIIIGDLNFLNPMEAFVLHVSFLVHDAGMCYSILDNKNEIENDPLYLDYISRKGDSEEVKQEALFFTVRERHGDFALRVATEKLRDGEFLISNTDLREELSSLIGKIAKSHTCNINYIENEFGGKYGTPKFPIDWTIDCQKLSFILRTADAAHIDNLRTPKTLKMISEIPGISKDHWTFQKKLGFPQLGEDGLLIYTTNNPFFPEEQKAWWFCYDALQVLNKELKQANEYFTTKNEREFLAKAVKLIDNPLELGKKHIKTSNWLAIDTRIQVSDPIKIAAQLGGIQLYGAKNIAVRELIQNSIDAINLYRLVSGQPNPEVGEINISITKNENDEFYLIITDTGIGMSQIVMSSELLDFGGSYWKSNRFQKEFQGMNSQGFDSIGQFGIGFFSIFMIGSNIQITSWRFGQSINEMMTLDFSDGLLSNPILRYPNKEESTRVKDRGTSIKIHLDDNPYSKEGICSQNFQNTNLESLVKFFVPSGNVRINITEMNGDKSVIEPCALENMDLRSTLNHLYLSKIDRHTIIEDYKKLNLPFFELKDSNKVYGKLLLLPRIKNTSIASTAVVMSKGIRVYDQLYDFAGFLYTDEIVSIKRDKYEKEIPFEVVLKFALEQKEYIEKNNLIPLYNQKYIELIFAINLFDENLPILFTKSNGFYFDMNIKQFRNYLNTKNSFRLYREGNFSSTRESDCDGLILRIFGNSFNELVKEEDKARFIKYDEYLKQIVFEEWGNFSNTSIPFRDEDVYRMDYPYNSIEEFVRN